jgi:CDP-6-deoxy-D-xylo-4-hexulose-3-dehydrase
VGPAIPYRLAADTFGAEEMRAAKAVLDSGQLTMNQQVRDFESDFAEWVGMPQAVMVNSGSSANLLMIDALLRSTSGAPRLLAGDEVIVPGLAWPTTVWPIAQLGLIPVFADIDPTTLAIDLDSALEVIGPRTRAMFLIHPLGRALDMPKYRDFCRDHGLELIEDCCESLGAHWMNAHVGSAGLAASFSFYFSHHLSTIEGGMVVTDDFDLANDLRGLRAHGWVRDRADKDAWVAKYPGFDPRFLFTSVGYNVRPTEIQGAIGRVQLKRLDGMLVAREKRVRAVREWLSSSAPWLELIGSESLDVPTTENRRERTNSWMVLPFRLGPDAPTDRDTVVAYLEDHGVETRPIIAGNLARHPAIDQVIHRCAAAMDACDAILRDTFMIGCHPVASPASLITLERAVAGLAGF